MKTAARKPHLNLSIDQDLLTLFEALKPIHGREYSEFLEEKIKSLILEVAPDKIMELEIKKTEERLAELTHNLNIVRPVYENLRKSQTEVKAKDNGVKDELEQYRDDMYIKYLEEFKRCIKNPKWFQWDTLQGIFRFKTKFETEDYILGRLKADGYMD